MVYIYGITEKWEENKMAKKEMTLQIVGAREVMRSKDPTKKWIKYLLKGADDKGAVHEVAYFYYPDGFCPVDGNGKLKENFYLQGTVSNSKYGDTFDRNVIQVEGFGGVPVARTPWDDEPPDPQDERRLSILQQSDTERAAPFAAKKANTWAEYIKELEKGTWMVKNLREKLTKQYIEEKRNG